MSKYKSAERAYKAAVEFHASVNGLSDLLRVNRVPPEETEDNAFLGMQAAAAAVMLYAPHCIKPAEVDILGELRDRGLEAVEDTTGDITFLDALIVLGDDVKKRAQWALAEAQAELLVPEDPTVQVTAGDDPGPMVARLRAWLAAIEMIAMGSSSLDYGHEDFYLARMKSEAAALIAWTDSFSSDTFLFELMEYPPDWPEDRLAIHVLAECEDVEELLSDTDGLLLAKREMSAILSLFDPELHPPLAPYNGRGDDDQIAVDRWSELCDLGTAAEDAVGPLPCALGDLRMTLFHPELCKAFSALHECYSDLYSVLWRANSTRGREQGVEPDGLPVALQARDQLRELINSILPAEAAIEAVAPALTAAREELQRRGVQAPEWLGAVLRGSSTHEAILNFIKDQLSKVVPQWRSMIAYGRVEDGLLGGHYDLYYMVKAWREMRPALAPWFKLDLWRGTESLLKAEMFLATRQSWPERLSTIASTFPSPTDSPGTSADQIPRLNETDQKVADYITQNPGKRGRDIAKAVDVDEGHFRSRIVPKLKRLGFTNNGDGEGYFPPPEASRAT